MPNPNVDQGLFGQVQKSTSSHTISNGNKVFTLDVDDGFIQLDYTVQIVSTADPDCWMYGVVTAKSSPNITVSIFKLSSTTGTFADWDIQVIAGPFAGLPASQTLGFSTNTASVPSVGDILNWTIETGKAFYDNTTIYVSAVQDRTAFFFATVVSYNTGTGSIKLVVNRVSGSGSYSLWALSLIDVTASFYTTRGNNNYNIKPSDKIVALTAGLSATRTWTLPLAASTPAGYALTLIDSVGGINVSAQITISPAGSDTINSGAFGFVTWDNTSGKITFYSDGVSNWSFDPIENGQYSGQIDFDGDVFTESSLVSLGDFLALGPAEFNSAVAFDAAAQFSGAVSVIDNLLSIKDNGDNSKVLKFDASGITTGNTRTLAAPDHGGEIQTDVLLTQTGAASRMGYNTGAGSTVTQTTSKSTAVTINRPTGRITMDNANLAANTTVAFTVNNSTVTGQDVVIVQHRSGGTLGSYRIDVDSVAGGSFVVRVTNLTGAGLAQALVLTFVVIGGSIN